MSASFVWIVFPVMSGIVLWFFRQYHRRLVISGCVICLVLFLMTVSLPFYDVKQHGSKGLYILSTTAFLGRQFILGETVKPILAMVYALACLWLSGLFLMPELSRMAPYILVFTGLMVATVAVQPFLFAALILEIAVLISIPLFVSTSRDVGKGLLRYLVFLTLAFSLILLAGWAANLTEASPANLIYSQRAALFLAVGFAILLAVFPFFTWLTMLFDETDIYASGFVLTLLSFIVLWMGISFLDKFGWLRTIEILPFMLRLTGGMMVFIGGILSGFERRLKRITAYITLMQNGYALIAVSLIGSSPIEVFANLLTPRLIMMFFLCNAIRYLERQGHLDTPSLFETPFTVAIILASVFSFAGLPTMANFPSLLLVIFGLAGHSNVILVLAGCGILGLLTAGIQLTVRSLSANQQKSEHTESRFAKIMYGFGMILCFLMGLFPGKIAGISMAFNTVFHNWH